MLYPVELPDQKKGSRGGQIRTDDLLVPNQARYRATLHPENFYFRKSYQTILAPQRHAIRNRAEFIPQQRDYTPKTSTSRNRTCRSWRQSATRYETGRSLSRNSGTTPRKLLLPEIVPDDLGATAPRVTIPGGVYPATAGLHPENFYFPESYLTILAPKRHAIRNRKKTSGEGGIRTPGTV